MELAETTFPSYEIENFIASCTNLTNTCFDGFDLSNLKQFSSGVHDLLHSQEDLSSGMKYILKQDDIFANYLPNKIELGKEDYLVGIENITDDIIKAICAFFEKLYNGLKDFITKLFDMEKKVAVANERNLNKLRPYFDKFNTKLNSIPANQNIPTHKDLVTVINNLHTLISAVTKINLHELDTTISDLLSGKTDTIDKDAFSYDKFFGDEYVELLSSVGIAVKDEVPEFESIFLNTNTDSTIGELEYTFKALVDVNKTMYMFIEPLKFQCEKLHKLLGVISTNLTKLKHNLSTDGKSTEKFKYILEELPPQISKLTGLYQKIGLATLTYEFKLADIIRYIHADLSLYSEK